MLNKIKRKYNSLSNPIKMSFWFMVCSFLQKAIGMLITPIFTRIMAEYEYGRYSIFTSWQGFFTAIISLNIAGGFYMRGLVINEDDRENFTSSLIGLTGLLSIVSLVIYFVFRNCINRLTGLNTFLVCVMIIQIFFVSSHSFWMNRKRIDFNYKPIVLLTILVSILSPIVSVLFVKLANAQTQVEGRVAATFLVDVFLYSGLVVALCKKGKVFYYKEYWRQALIFSFPLIPHYLSKIVLNQADRVMIGNYCGMAQAGYYSVAYSLAAIVQIFNQAVTASLDPWLYGAIQKKSFEKIKKVSLSILIVMATLNIGVVSVAPEILKVFAPSNYYSAVWVIPPVTVSVFFMFMYDLFTAFQYFYAKTKWIMTASVVGALLNIVLNMIFIPKFGFIAAGYTTLFCYICFGIAHYIFMCKVCDEFLEGIRPYNIVEILLIGLALIVLAGVIMVLYPYPLVRYLILVSIVVLVFIKRNKIISLFKEMK